MMPRVSSHTVVWMCGLIATIGCSSSGESKPESVNANPEAAVATASNAKTDNACQLLTRAEAARVLSSSIDKVGDEGTPSPMGTALRSSCFYSADDGGTVQLTVTSYQSAQEATAKYDQLKGLYSGARPVANVGDDAFGERQTLVVKQGSRYLTVEMDPVGAKAITDYSNAQQMDALYAAERQIALQALNRLPASTATSVVTTTASGKSVCSIVSKDQMEALLGGPLTHAVPSDSREKTVCRYTGVGGRYAEVTIEWQGGETGMAGARIAGALMGGGSGEKVVTPVQGVGDEAVMLVGGVLNVRKGAALITVDLRGQQNSEAKAAAIAQIVVSRI